MLIDINFCVSFLMLLLVFTSTSDGKKLEFYGDRGSKFSKDEIQSMKGKYLRDTAGRQSSSDGRGEHDDAEKYSSEALSTDVSRRDFSTGEAPEGDKVGPLPSDALQTSPKTDGVMGLLVVNDNDRDVHAIKEVLFVFLYVQASRGTILH